MKNLVATDQEIDAILRDASLLLREKRQILPDALNRLQPYKSMINSESVANSISALPSTDARFIPSPAMRRQQYDTYRPVIQSSPQRIDNF